MSSFLRIIVIKRGVKIAAAAVAGILLFILVTLAFIPTIISSHSVQTRVQKLLSSSMKRQVAWSNLVMTWSDGLTLSGLKLGDGSAPLLNAAVDHISVVPGFGRGSDGRFEVDLAISIRNVRADLAPGPPKPPPPPTGKDPLTALAEAIQRFQGLDIPLPVELRVMVEAAPLQLSYRAPASGKLLQIQDFLFRFAMPSLATKPVTVEFDGRVSVDGRKTGNVSFKAEVSDLVTKGGRIHPASALCAVDASAPGTNLTMSGGLSQSDGFSSRLKLDLPGVLEAAQPFMSPAIPQLAGNVELLLRAKTDASRDLHATLTLGGAGLAARGGPLKARQVGPLELKLQQQIATDHVRQRVEFPKGSLVIPALIDGAWSASVTRPTVQERSLEVHVGPLRLDLARALSVAAPFLPSESPAKDLAGEMNLRSLDLKLHGPRNNGELAIAGFGVKLPRLRLALKKGDLAAADLELFLDKAACPLVAQLPTSLTADLLWSVKNAALSGTQPLTIQGARGTVGVAVTDLNLKSASPRKVAAAANVTQTLDCERASGGARFVVEKVHEKLHFRAAIAGNGDIEAGVPELVMTAASLRGVHAGKQYGPLPLAASLNAAGFRLAAAPEAQPSLQHAVARISSGDALQLDAEAALSAAVPQRAATSGTLRFDLRRALPFAAPFLPSGLKADGVAIAAWNLAAPLPKKVPETDTHPLRTVRAGLSLFDTFDVSVKLDTLSVTVPAAKGSINITGLHTRPDLRIISTRNGESVRIDGGVSVAGLNGLPGTAGRLPSQHGLFSLGGELTGWRELRVNEELRIEPLSFTHEAELNVSRIDSLFDEKQPFSTATLFKRLDATLIATMEAGGGRDVQKLLPGFEQVGKISSSARVDLTAARDIALRWALKTDDFGMQLTNGTRVEGLRSDIVINRLYALTAARNEAWTPLTTALVRPAAVAAANPGAADLAGRIHDDLRGDVRGARSFTIRRVTTTASGVPLEFTALEGDLLFNQEKTGLSFFQADLLGGTLLARSVFDLKTEIPVIAAASSFSNLDITYLLPKESRKRQGDRDAEITGEMSVTAPLTAEQRELFEQLRLGVNIRKIGANTIERALFSLDPYERNEQIVAQRKMLRMGGLKGLRASAVDGAFSMEGEAQIKGVAVDLPKVERLRISELPLRQELARNSKGIAALRGFLDLVRADTLVIGPKGELSLKRRSYAQ